MALYILHLLIQSFYWDGHTHAMQYSQHFHFYIIQKQSSQGMVFFLVSPFKFQVSAWKNIYSCVI